ncbi:MAG: argininosuccinate lyase [Candidatus Woesearchaeota archaeon]
MTIKKIWETKKTKLNEDIEKYTIDSDYIIDNYFIPYDIKGSIAHAKMLEKIKILKKYELIQIEETLKELTEKYDRGEFKVFNEEDCHSAIENYLVKKLGVLGKKIHTARSRNDQIMCALKLFMKDKLKQIIELCYFYSLHLQNFNKKYGKIKIIGYTHTRRAMPSTIGLWIQSFIESNEDNIKFLENVYEILDSNPLGTGAGYGLPIYVDRELTTKELAFSRIQENPVYVQNSRGKNEAMFIYALLNVMLDLNKLATDIILFSTDEFGIFELGEEITTGSSIMPNKRNPDVLEIMRAKSKEVESNLFKVLNIYQNLPSGYNRDMQLTKKTIVESYEITKDSLKIIKIVLENTNVNEKRCNELMKDKNIKATEKVYKLVKKGIPFREAYKNVKRKLFKDNT